MLSELTPRPSLSPPRPIAALGGTQGCSTVSAGASPGEGAQNPGGRATPSEVDCQFEAEDFANGQGNRRTSVHGWKRPEKWTESSARKPCSSSRVLPWPGTRRLMVLITVQETAGSGFPLDRIFFSRRRHWTTRHRSEPSTARRQTGASRRDTAYRPSSSPLG
jgi:hypothetical protein